jgi:tetratricopeptide (TPR) repeat protein
VSEVRRVSSWLAVAGLCFALPYSAAPLRGQSAQAPDRFQQWLDAIDAHQPGNPGKPAVEVSTWSGDELDAVIAEAKRHARGLAKSDPARANQILLRGAALHGDIGRLIPEDPIRRSPNQRTAYIVRDGRWLGVRYISIHWGLARTLLDSVTPEPAADPGVHEWYLQMSEDLLRMRQFAAAIDHHARARQIFPSDPAILFASGRLHELFGSNGMQAAAESISDSNRTAAAVSNARGELVRAERYFRDALAQRPDLVAARVHHAHVLSDLGRHAEASEALGRAIDTGASGKLLYFAYLFLGRAEEALGRGQAAKVAFERASAVYPNAQSPHLALSQIARRSGDRRAAQHELQVIAALPDDDRRREDPWWSYFDMP